MVWDRRPVILSLGPCAMGGMDDELFDCRAACQSWPGPVCGMCFASSCACGYVFDDAALTAARDPRRPIDMPRLRGLERAWMKTCEMTGVCVNVCVSVRVCVCPCVCPSLYGRAGPPGG